MQAWSPLRDMPKTSASSFLVVETIWRSTVRSTARSWSRMHRGALELHAFRGRLHLLGQPPHHVLGFAFEEEEHLLDDLVVLLFGAERRARRDATLDVVIEAGARVFAGDLLCT